MAAKSPKVCTLCKQEEGEEVEFYKHRRQCKACIQKNRDVSRETHLPGHTKDIMCVKCHQSKPVTEFGISRHTKLYYKLCNGCKNGCVEDIQKFRYKMIVARMSLPSVELLRSLCTHLKSVDRPDIWTISNVSFSDDINVDREAMNLLIWIHQYQIDLDMILEMIALREGNGEGEGDEDEQKSLDVPVQ